MTRSPVLAWSVDVAQTPADRLDVAFVAEPSERAALAGAYGLVDVKAFSATASIHRDANGITVDGRIVADIVQTCVVSLVPVDQHIDEAMAVRFVGPASPERPALPKPGVEVIIRANEPEPPEVLPGSRLDLGALAEEHFVLAIDPYPRARGATMPPDTAVGRPDTDADSPFAALAAISGRPAKR